MIRTNNGAVKLKGSVSTLLCELTVTTKSILDAFAKNGIPEKEARSLIDKAIELAFKSEEELRTEAHEVLTKLSGRLFDALFVEESDWK